MKLKTKVLLSMVFLGSMFTAMTTVGAVHGGSKKAATAVTSKRKVGKCAGKTKRNLTGHEALDCIASLVALTPQDRTDLDQGSTTIWNILVAKKKWHAIRCLLGTDGRGLFSKEVVDVFRESFVNCVSGRSLSGPLQTPLSLAEQQGTVAALKGCVPSNLPERLKKKLPPVLNTFRT